MRKLEGMLMIGAAGANVGKTELACALIRTFGRDRRITGIKVTAIKTKGGQCPRGGAGCGVCSSIDGDFAITQEKNSASRKDTSRLLKAGATRVFWLRAIKTKLQEALAALLDIIGPDAVSICESNSLRQVLEPALFLMVAGPAQQAWKNSARQVKKYADRIIISDPKRFDFDIGRINLVDGKWAIREQATAIIMAGGRSTRIGRDKSILPIGDKPMIKHICDQLVPHFDQLLISANDPSTYDFLALEVVPDAAPGRGPLMGIASALKASANEVNFVIACDIPEVNIRLLRRMLRQAGDYDAVIPRTAGSQYEPLFAVYKKNAVDAMQNALSSGKTRVMDGLNNCTVKYIDLDPAERPKNINTMQDYTKFVQRQKDAIV
ncbi:MAG: molybdenum cofactor guanylyltransferase [Planctomycetota bacterium]|jgi:molybdopterin-guanine dinucleotide biosynthesis protein A